MSAGKPAPRRRRCRFCGGLFLTARPRQIYCRSRECFRKQRSSYMKQYMRRWKLTHPNYWKSERQYEYLRRWRKAHPGYFSRWHKRRPTR